MNKNKSDLIAATTYFVFVSANSTKKATLASVAFLNVGQAVLICTLFSCPRLVVSAIYHQ